MSGVERIAQERDRQKAELSEWHDDRLVKEELACAAVCYTLPAWVRDEVPMKLDPIYDAHVPCSRAEAEFYVPEIWPFAPADWKPSPVATTEARIRELTKAGALIAAEIDRLEHKMAHRQAA